MTQDNKPSCDLPLSPDVGSLDSEGETAPTTERSHPPVVEFRKVSKTFNQGTKSQFKALDEITFCIEDIPNHGEFISIIGPSGCGKSTVLNLIAGFQEVYPPSSGDILVRGEKLKGPGSDRGMVFQKYSSFPHLTVKQNVSFGLDLNKQKMNLSSKEIDDMSTFWLDKVGLSQHSAKYPHQLSGGQQQRVAIARTLALKPRIILMDEAFSALDEPTRLEMQMLLVELWHEVQATVFLVTHSISEAVYLGDRVWIFSQAPGQIVKELPDIPRSSSEIPANEVQKNREFLELVEEVSSLFSKVERGEPVT